MQKLKPFGTIFGEAWAIYKSQFGVLVSIASIPPFIFFLAGLSASLHIILLILGIVVGLVFSFASGLALIYTIKDKTDFKTSYKMAFAGFMAYGWIVFLIMLITLGGFFMGFIPGIIFSIFFVFSVYAFVFEGDKGLNALLKSREYVRNYWWPVWWKMFLIGLVTGLPVLLVSIISFTVLYIQQVPESSTQDIVGAVRQLVGVIIAPLIVAYALSLYRNLTQIKPELVGKKPETKRGFWIFAAIWGVVGVILLPILATFAVIILNPSGLLQQARDSQRMADLASLKSMINFYQVDVNEEFCVNFEIHYSTEGTRAIDGTGWLPIDFTQIEGGNPITILPIDPVNNDDYLYAYACNPASQKYEFDAALESGRFSTSVETDKGNNRDIYEVGTDLNILR